MSIASKRRETEVFSLAFLDCICCGFGAVILFYLVAWLLVVILSPALLRFLVHQKIVRLHVLAIMSLRWHSCPVHHCLLRILADLNAS